MRSLKILLALSPIFLSACVHLPMHGGYGSYGGVGYGGMIPGGQNIVETPSVENPTTLNPVYACREVRASPADYEKCMEFIKEENNYHRSQSANVGGTKSRVYENSIYNAQRNQAYGGYGYNYGHYGYAPGYRRGYGFYGGRLPPIYNRGGWGRGYGYGGWRGYGGFTPGPLRW